MPYPSELKRQTKPCGTNLKPGHHSGAQYLVADYPGAPQFGLFSIVTWKFQIWKLSNQTDTNLVGGLIVALQGMSAIFRISLATSTFL